MAEAPLWSGWRSALIIVKPETVLSWHRKGFQWYWTWKIRHWQSGRPRVPMETRDLIRTMSRDTATWGAPRIHSELLKLGIEISQAAVAKYMVQHPKPPSQTWKTFLAKWRLGKSLKPLQSWGFCDQSHDYCYGDIGCGKATISV